MPAPEINPDLLVDAPEDGTALGTVARGNHATHGDAYSGGNQHIEKSCVVRQNIYCAKALEASAYTVRTSNYGDSNDPQFDDEHVYHSVISAGFVKNDIDGNFLFGQDGDGQGATSLDGLDDVTLTGPLLGRQYLCFDSGLPGWVNQTIVLDDLGDVIILSPGNGDYLCFSNGDWINAGIPLDTLSDVSTAGAVAGNEVLQFDGASSFVFGLLNLNSLSNVDLSGGQSIGDHLEFNGTNWVPADPGHSVPGAESLNDLSDVSLSSLADNNVLQFDGSEWVNRSDVELSSTSAYYLGEKDSTGSWRFVRNGTDLEVEVHESGSYVSKGSFTP